MLVASNSDTSGVNGGGLGGYVYVSQKDISIQTTPCYFVLQAKALKSQQNMQDWGNYNQLCHL